MKKSYLLQGLIFVILVISVIIVMPMANAQNFSDVQSTNINKDAIEFFKSTNVIQGYSDGTYKPENRINRAEFIKIIVASQVKNPTGSNCFKDVKDEWFAKYVCTAKSLGYIQGYSDGTFKPGEYINFAEASKIITKALSVTPDTTGTNNEWFAGFVNALAEKNAIPTTIQFFDKDVSRGEMAEVMWRVKEKVTDKVSQDYESITKPFPAIKSCDALQEKFKEYQSYHYGYIRGDVVFDMESLPTGATPEMAKTEAAPATAGESVTATDYSTTNIQVKGVDEADIIKNDGKYIYMIKGNTVRIVEAYPPSIMKEVSTVKFDEDNFNPSEMFVDGDRLVVIGQSWNYYGGVTPLIYPRPWNGSQTKVYILDITDRSNPETERELAFDGNYQTSRRINNNMYLVLNESPNVWIMDQVKSGEDLLPRMKDGKKDEVPLARCIDIQYFPGFVVPNYLIVASIPLDDPTGDIDREVFLGSSDNVYTSRTHLYVATNRTAYDYYTDWDWHRDSTRTLVFKFALENGKINFLSRGDVPGRILNQFSMDANMDNFRIATTIDSWDSEHPSGNNVYIMDKDMKVVGKIEEIAPGERIYSTRFIEDRLYMVTFRQIDPLFVISLADPTNPKILGKLKIPGFSNYMHPYDKNHIIGFGKETVDNKYGNVIATAFKMALFDVSDVENPKQQFVETIGDQGTYSELLNNHKALLFDKDKELLAFPITIQEKVTSEELNCGKYRYDTCPSLCMQRCIPTSCTVDAQGVSTCTDDCGGPGSCTSQDYEQYSTTFSGAMVYTLNLTDGFKLRGKITHYDNADILKMGDYWPYNYDKNIQRIIYIGDYLYTISQSKVKANDINTVKDVNAVDIK